jgi:hypothetical protein
MSEEQVTPKIEIEALGRVRTDHDLETNLSRNIIYALSIAQPVQAWVVYRNHDEFISLAATLFDMGFQAPNILKTLQNEDIALNVSSSLNELQSWLDQVLRHPQITKCEHLNRFLCDGANQPHPLFNSIEWVCSHIETPNSQSVLQLLPPSEMMCYDMSDSDDTDDSGENEVNDNGPPLNNDYDEDHHCQRYQPTEEELTENDVIEFNSICKDVEMVESIEKLGRSLGDPHLSTSLKQRAKMSSDSNRSGVIPPNHLDHSLILCKEHSGCTEYADPSTTDPSLYSRMSVLIPPKGQGIGEALRKEVKYSNVTSKNLHHSSISPYEKKHTEVQLDNFKLIKVLGKGSFGTYNYIENAFIV